MIEFPTTLEAKSENFGEDNGAHEPCATLQV